MNGPYTLSYATIDAVVTLRSPGVYELLVLYQGPVRYVGRSDDDLNARLKQWVGSKYRYFTFEYCSSARDAFYKECTLYHQHGGSKGLDNDRHPDRPSGTDWKCPVCGR
ncbi:MAG: hypothetical protein ACM3ZO_05070 [Clostridia bacterium]